MCTQVGIHAHTHIGRLALCVPALCDAASRLTTCVLPEPQILRSHTHPHQKLLDAPHEVAQCLVGHRTL